MKQTLVKPTYTKNGKLHRSRIWDLRVRIAGESKPRSISLGVTDRRCAEKKRAEIVAELEREACGVIPPKTMRRAAERSFAEHATDYTSDLAAQGRSNMHVYTVGKLLSRLAKECRWRALHDVTSDSFLDWRGKQTLAPKTLNEYLSAVCAMFNWLDIAGRVDGNPLRRVRKVETRGKEKRKRRALTPADLQRFLQAARMHGLAYMVAINTGMRRGELEKLAWGDVRLSEQSEVCLRASTTKNAKDARQPLWIITADLLREARPKDAHEGTLVFGLEGVPSMGEHRRYLQAAGIAYKDGLGRQLDFHAMRHTFSTLLALSGAELHLRKEAMRHSDSRLTENNYTDKLQLPIAVSVAKLEKQFFGDCRLALGLAPEVVTNGHLVSQTVLNRPREGDLQLSGNEQVRHEISRDVTNCPKIAVAASLGFEPRQNDSESFVLPLHHEAI